MLKVQNIEKVLVEYFPEFKYSSLSDFTKRTEKGDITVSGEQEGEDKVRRSIEIYVNGEKKTYSALYQRSGAGFKRLNNPKEFNPDM